jgi:hypothetical protein
MGEWTDGEITMYELASSSGPGIVERGEQGQAPQEQSGVVIVDSAATIDMSSPVVSDVVIAASDLTGTDVIPMEFGIEFVAGAGVDEVGNLELHKQFYAFEEEEVAPAVMEILPATAEEAAKAAPAPASQEEAPASEEKPAETR